MKKLISISLCLAILLSFSVSSSADAKSNETLFLNGNNWGDTYSEVREAMTNVIESESYEDGRGEQGLLLTHDQNIEGIKCYESGFFFKYDSLYAIMHILYDPMDVFDVKVMLDKLYGKGRMDNEERFVFSTLYYLLSGGTEEINKAFIEEMFRWEISDASSVLLCNYNDIWYLVVYNLDYYEIAPQTDGL